MGKQQYQTKIVVAKAMFSVLVNFFDDSLSTFMIFFIAWEKVEDTECFERSILTEKSQREKLKELATKEFSKEAVVKTLRYFKTRFDISRPDFTFRDQNCWFNSNPESTVWMVSVFFQMAIPILMNRINKMGSRINKVGPRIDKGVPRINKGGAIINKVGKPETTNRVARPTSFLLFFAFLHTKTGQNVQNY